MSEPRRLLEAGGDFERSLLGAWQDEKPSPRARAELLALAGLTATAATAATTGTVGAATAAGGSIAPKAAGLGGVALAKWLAVAVAVLLAATAAVVATRHDTAPVLVAPRSTEAPPLATAALPVDAPAPPLAGAPLAPTVPVAPTAPVAAPRAAVPKPHDPPAPTSTLADQVSAMDRARAALEEGDAARALRLVDEYEAHFRGGAFQQEADVLRVEALVRRGDRAGAQRAGARFLAAHPQSPHASHVRALLEGPDGTPP
jgi:hypothetical protein